MKKVISILIVCVLLLHLAGFYVYFLVRLGEIRTQIRRELALLPVESLDLITVSKKQFQKSWTDDLEMKWKGRMYDIARVEVDGDVVKVFARHDSAEDDLLSFITSIVQTASQDEQRVPNSVFRFFTLEFEVLNKMPVAFLDSTRFDHSSRYLTPQSFFDLSITSPPPRG